MKSVRTWVLVSMALWSPAASTQESEGSGSAVEEANQDLISIDELLAEVTECTCSLIPNMSLQLSVTERCWCGSDGVEWRWSPTIGRLIHVTNEEANYRPDPYSRYYLDMEIFDWDGGEHATFLHRERTGFPNRHLNEREALHFYEFRFRQGFEVVCRHALDLNNIDGSSFSRADCVDYVLFVEQYDQ